MTGREAAICGRVQEFRILTGLSRTAFAKRTGIDTPALVRYEHHRAALKYADASRLIQTFSLNPEWLATGGGSPMSCVRLDETAFAEQVPFRALFTAIYDRFVFPELKKQQAAMEELVKLRANPPEALRAEMIDYSANVQARAEAMREDLALREARCGKLEARVNAMRKDLQSRELYLAKLEAGISGIRRTYGSESDQAYWAKIQALATATARAKQSAALQNSKLSVDNSPDSGRVFDVNSIGHWESLVERIAALTSAPGAKVRLAQQFDTTRQAVNKWLSKKGAPNAELTLRLLDWVQTEEAKQKRSSRSVPPPRERKTQVRSSTVYEKAKSSPPKR